VEAAWPGLPLTRSILADLLDGTVLGVDLVADPESQLQARPFFPVRHHGAPEASGVDRGTEPCFILSCYTDHVPAELPDGLPGFAAAAQLVGRLCRTTWGALAV